MICHKLRTPMVGLLGSLGFMVQHADKLSDTEISEFSEMALKSVERLHGEIEDILQYLNTSHKTSGSGFKLASLQELITLVCTNLQIEHTNISIQKEVHSLWLPLSQQAVELILWEILENSKKFHPRQTPVVELFVTSGVVHENSGIHLKIQDNGLWLSPEQLSHMWTPYYQGEKYSTGEVQGMGLGLSTVASLVWEVGGTCRAYNRKDGPGVVVELFLPVLT